MSTGAFTHTNIQEVNLTRYSSGLMTNTFNTCSSLSTINAPSVTYISDSVFTNCIELRSISFPLASYIGNSGFTFCSALERVSFPLVSMIGSNGFGSCMSLSTVILNHSSTNRGMINQFAFNNCRSLTSLYLLASMSYTLGAQNVFYYTPMSNSSYLGYYGSIYVPSSMYDWYISSTVWSFYSARFVPLTDAQVSNVLASGTHL